MNAAASRFSPRSFLPAVVWYDVSVRNSCTRGLFSRVYFFRGFRAFRGSRNLKCQSDDGCFWVCAKVD